MAEAIVSVVLEQLMKVAGGQIQQEVKLVKGVDDEVRKLTSNFQTIQAVIADAEKRQVTEAAVSLWLEKLKDVSYDMDNVLDKRNTSILQSLQTDRAEGVHTLKSKVRSFFLFPYSGLKQVVLSYEIGFKIKAINKSLDAIAKEKDNYNFKITTSIEQPHQRAESTSIIKASEVFGRDENLVALVGKLLHESCEERNGLHIISIVGMGGIGKTTLAQLAYNNDEVVNFFEKRIWVCVSDPFDMLRIAKAILETLEGHTPNLSTLQSLLDKISESLRRKKFLIVLDDVWIEDYKDWEQVHHCLKNGLHGSKILVTTRNQRTADMMESNDIISIKELSKEQCWSLFRRFAFFGRSLEECEKLEEIGREIVSKCKGLPLAVKTMGSLLRFKKTGKEWESILHSEMWKLEEFEKCAFPHLLLSYYDLPSMVKLCFTYCAMFPKDFNFEKDELIQLWMAQGYLGLDHNEEIEIIGEKYFNSLAMRSFFQEFEKDDGGNIIRCKMHDIVHDVAQFLSKNECCMIEAKELRKGNIQALYEKTHHLRLMVRKSDTFPISICNFKKLRSLLIQFDGYVDEKLIGNVLPKLFDELTCLKALRISGERPIVFRHIIKLNYISKHIGKLIHLRYLDLSNNWKLIKLPEAFCELYNLQTLKLDRCKSLKTLPEGIGKLINLRYLMNYGTDSLSYMPKGIKRLTHLRTLSEFHLDSGDYAGKACPPECLNNFQHLESLGIEMSRSDWRKNEAILEAFQPSPNLQRLTILGHGSRIKFRITALTNLRFISLIKSTYCYDLPPLGKLPSLETLYVQEMYRVTSVGNEFLGVESDEASSSSSLIYFPKLKTLKFENMMGWEVWDFGIENHTTIMPSLCSLKIKCCRKLKGLPKQLLQRAPLQNLVIQDCDILGQLYEKGAGEKWQDISHIPNIQFLRIW